MVHQKLISLGDMDGISMEGCISWNSEIGLDIRQRALLKAQLLS
jgi:hypothetical protein